MKIAFFEIEGWEEKLIKGTLAGHEITLFKEPLTADCIPERRGFDVISVFVDSRIDGEVLNYFSDLKFIATRSTGYDHISTTICRDRGIGVAYVPGYGDNTVAEFAFGLILNLTRKIYQGIDQIKERESFSLEGLRGMDLKDKTMGVVGTGRIGREVIKIAKGFGMKVVASDMYPDEQVAKELGFGYLPFEKILASADVISLHCPLTEKTKHLINLKNIKLIKKGAYLVNTARGAIVETEALIQALQGGFLAGAALDVLEEEGEIKDELKFLSKERMREAELKVLLQDHVLMRMPNVLVTPHNAFNSDEALERILDTTLTNIRAFAESKPTNLVP